MCDYAWHVQSGSGDVINLFQQETDAWMSHTNTHHHTCTHSNKHTRHRGNKANVTVSRKQSPKSAAWHSVIIPPHAYLHSGLRIRLGATVSTPRCTPLRPPLLRCHPLSPLHLPFGLPLHSPASFCYLSLCSIVHASPKTLSLLGFICLLSVDSTWPCMAAPID